MTNQRVERAGCGSQLTEAFDLPVEQRQPCPRCGSLGRAQAIELDETLPPMRDSIGLKHKRPGKKKPILESFSGEEQSAGGGWVSKLRVIDRLKKRYRELVMEKDGTVTRDVDEPLEEHRGHGSARKDHDDE